MGARVLVVDDSATIRKVVSAILQRSGHEPLTASDGVQALELLKAGTEKVDLVLVDFVMQKMNGYEFCRRVRADAALKGLPIVLMSAKAEKIRGQFVEQTGAIDAISKPFDARALLVLIEGALQKIQQGKATRKAPEAMPTTPPESVRPDSMRPPPQSIRGRHDELSGPGISAQATALAKFVAPHLEQLAGGALVGRELALALSAALTDEAANKLSAAIEPKGDRVEVLRGRADAVPLGELMQLLQMQMQTGQLVVHHEKQEVSITFNKGLVDLAAFRGSADEFKLGRYLIEEGHIDQAMLDEVLTESRAQKKLLGDALMQRGSITQEQLQGALERQASEIIYEVLRWREARYWFYQAGEVPKEAEQAQLGLPIASLVMEGFRRVDEWRLIEESLDFDWVLYRDQAAIDRLGEARLGRLEKTVLEAIDGKKTVREVVSSVNASNFDTCKVVHQLVQSRLVRKKVA